MQEKSHTTVDKDAPSGSRRLTAHSIGYFPHSSLRDETIAPLRSVD